MSEWKKVKLGEVANYVNDKIDIKAFDTSLYISTDSMLKDKGGIGTPESIPESGKVTKYQHNDILVSNIRPYFKKIWFSNREGGCSNDVLVFRANNKVDSTFLYYILCDDSFFDHIMSGANGTKMPRGNKKLIPSFEIPLPPLSIQHRIATILSRYDSLIENYQKQIKLLEEAAQRFYKEWFIDLHFPGHENTNIIDGVPEGWERKKVGDVCQTVGGGTPSTKVAEYYDDGNIKWVTPTDITRSNCLCLFDTDKKITEEGLTHSSAKMLPPETILMTSRASVGYFGIYDCKVCTNQGFISCIPNESSYQMYLLYNLMNRVEEIRQKAGGSTYLEISKSVFRDFDIVLPNSKILESFQEQSHKMLDCMRQIASQLRLLTEARDRLLPKLMSGEIEV